MQIPFPSLSPQGQVRRLAGLARTALAAYGVPVPRLQLLKHSYNTTFRVTARNGDRYLLRIHPPGKAATDAVRSELLWLAALRSDADLPVPNPVPNAEQRLVSVVTHPAVSEPRLCVLFRWMEGRFLYRGLTAAHLEQVGCLLARMQHHAASWQRPDGFTRGRVDNLDSMQRGPADNFDERVAAQVVRKVVSVSTPEVGDLVKAAIERVWAALRAAEQEPNASGLIHGDLHHWNFLFHDGAARAIDFDDCGYGHWLYDLAVPLTALARHPRYASLRQALLAGYRQCRRLPAEQAAQLEALIALRRIQNMLWASGENAQPAFQEQWAISRSYDLQQLREFVDQ